MSLLVEFPEVESDPSLEVPLLDESVELDDELLDALPVLDAAEVVAEVSIPPTPGAASDPVEWDPPPEQGVQVGTAIQEVEPRPPLELPDELPLDPESVAPPGSDPEVGPAPPIATADPLTPGVQRGFRLAIAHAASGLAVRQAGCRRRWSRAATLLADLISCPIRW